MAEILLWTFPVAWLHSMIDQPSAAAIEPEQQLSQRYASRQIASRKETKTKINLVLIGHKVRVSPSIMWCLLFLAETLLRPLLNPSLEIVDLSLDKLLLRRQILSRGP
jgi:hypothetical protein